jgi:hypothetical protein
MISGPISDQKEGFIGHNTSPEVLTFCPNRIKKVTRQPKPKVMAEYDHRTYQWPEGNDLNGHNTSPKVLITCPNRIQEVTRQTKRSWTTVRIEWAGWKDQKGHKTRRNVWITSTHQWGVGWKDHRGHKTSDKVMMIPISDQRLIRRGGEELHRSALHVHTWKTKKISEKVDLTLQQKSYLCLPFLGIARPQQSQFPHSCVCEQFIYSHERSRYFLH